MKNSMTFIELCEKLKDVDEVTLMEKLQITSEQIVDKFQDTIEEMFEALVIDFEEDYGE
jgi:hypothetical protein